MKTVSVKSTLSHSKLIVGALLALITSHQAQANLIVNGGSTVSVNSGAVLNVNCGDVSINSGGTLEIDTATIDNVRNVNTAPGGSLVDNGATINDCSRVTFSKSFSPTTIDPGDVSTLTYTINNFSNADATGIAFSDSLDIVSPLNQLSIASPSNASTSCTNGVVSASSASSSLSFSGGELIAGNSCTISVDVTTNQPGSHLSSSSNLVSNLGQGNTATARLTVNDPDATSGGGGGPGGSGSPSITFNMSLSHNNIGPGSSVTAIYTIIESGGEPVNSLNFTHILPAGVTISPTANAQTNCQSATLIAPGGGSLISLTSGEVALSSACTVSVNLTATIAATYTLTTGDLTSSFGNSGSASASFTVDAATQSLGLSKNFSPATIDVGERSTLSYTFATDAAATREFGAFDFTDVLPDGLEIANPSNFSSTCDLTNGTRISADPGSNTFEVDNQAVAPTGVPLLSAGSSCSFSVDVVANQAGTFYSELNSFAGLYNAFSTFFFNQFFSAVVPAELEVVNSPLMLQRQFIDDPVPPGGTATVEYRISNFNRDPVTNVSFSDAFSGSVPGLSVTSVSNVENCGLSAQTSGSGTLTFSDGELPSGESCTFTAQLAVPNSSGVFSVTTDTITGEVLGSTVSGNQAQDNIVIAYGLDFSKEFIDDPVGAGSDVTLRYTITNQSPLNPATNVSFTDSISALSIGLQTANITLPTAGFCGAPSSSTIVLLSTANGEGMSFQNMELAPSQTCTFDVTISIPAGTPGTTVLSESSSISGIINSALFINGKAADYLQVQGSPLFTKLFTDSPVQAGDQVTLEYTITNRDAANALTDISFTDDFDSLITGLAVSTLPADDFCGTGSSASGSSVLTVSGANLAAGATCQFEVTLTVPVSTPSNSYTSSSSPLLATNLGVPVTGGVASTDLIVSEIDFTVSQISGSTAPGDMAILEYSITNNGVNDATGIVFTQALNALPGLAAIAPLPTEPCGAGSTLSGTTFLIFVGGNVAAGDSCTFQVNALVPAGSAERVTQIPTSNVSATINGGAATIEPANLRFEVANPAIELDMSFDSQAPVAPSSQIGLNLTLTNPEPVALSNIQFSLEFDSVLSGLTYTADVASPASLVCGTAASSAFNGGLSGNTMTLSNVNLGANASCEFRLLVNVPSSAPFSSTYDLVSSTISAVSGGFTASGGTSTATFSTISNPDTTPSLTIGAPSSMNSNGQPVTFVVNYSNAVAITLDASDITLSSTDSATASISVNSITNDSAMVELTPSGLGTIAINIAAGTARGTGPDLAPAAGPSAAITVDTVPPVISLNGANPQIIELGDGYTELGATTDDGSAVIINASAFVDAVGNYLIRYDATDAFGNNAIQVTRTVMVQDTTAPVITLNGNNPQTIELGDGYTELGASTDDGSAVVINDSDFQDAIGTYTIRYNATDAESNAAIEVTRTVNVVDTTAPIITLAGSNPQTIELGDGYTELGASTDDGSLVIINSSAFQDAVGSYIITYNATDSENNAALQVTRTVNVVDTTAPIITLIGDNPQNIDLGDGYTELGATTDDGTVVSIDTSDFRDSVGSYIIVYSAVDSENNTAIPVERTVVVIDPNDRDGDRVDDAQDNCPLIANADQADLDNDGQGNACDFDDDGDGMLDTWELENGLNPLNSFDRDADPDGDGFTNRQEHDFNTDPNVPDLDENQNGIPDIVDARNDVNIAPILMLLLLDE